jgi:hypothetical protein
MKPTKPKPNKLESYYELITSLEMKLDEVKELKGQEILLKADAEALGQKREEVLAGTVTDATDAAIDHLAKFNARQEVFGVKLKHIEGQIKTAEEALQYTLVADFISPFRALYGSLLHHRLERAKAQIAKLIVPERVTLMDNLIEQLARQSKEYAAEQALELFLPDGASTPLHDTPGVPWSRYREQTMQILLQAVEGGLEKAKKLLAAVEAEKGFTPPELTVPSPEPAPEQAVEPEPALA